MIPLAVVWEALWTSIWYKIYFCRNLPEGKKHDNRKILSDLSEGWLTLSLISWGELELKEHEFVYILFIESVTKDFSTAVSFV